MKQNGIRILALILAGIMSLSAFSCGKEETPSQPSPMKTEQTQTEEKNKQAGQDKPTEKTGDEESLSDENPAPSEPAETEWSEPDYSDFVMPEDTGKLYLYVDSSMGKSIMNPAIERFKELYPDVEVTYEIVDPDAFDTRLQTELPAGSGPDVVFFLANSIPDVSKTMATGLFIDLGPYFETDAEIDPGDFVDGVMRCGMYQGRRYFVPLCFNAPILVARRSMLDELGIDDPSDFSSLTEAARRYHEAYPDGSLFMDSSSVETWSINLRYLVRFSGMRFIDYERGLIECDEEQLREIMDLMKIYYDPNYVENDKNKADRLNGDYMRVDCLLKNECLFNDYDNYYYAFSRVKKALAKAGDEAVAFVPRDMKGNITAEYVQSASIPQGAKNKLNAWRLIKILLSDEIQSARDESRLGNSIFWSGKPVRISALRKDFEYEVGFWGLDIEDPEEQKLLDEFVELWSSPTNAQRLPDTVSRYINLELMPYVKGEKQWNDCYKRFMNTLELYASE